MTVTLHLGDCLDYMRTMDAGSVDAVVTDPPYGMKNNPDAYRFSGGQSPLITRVDNTPGPFSKPIIGDDKPFDPSPFLGFDKVVLWGFQHFASRLPVGSTFVWIKKDAHLWGTFLSDADLAWSKGGYGVYCFQRNWSGFSRLQTVGKASHPNEKPIELMAWCMDQAGIPRGATVFDPYMGSGTTGVACVLTGRHFVGCEIDPVHFATAQRRIAEAQLQPPLFPHEPQPVIEAARLPLFAEVAG